MKYRIVNFSPHRISGWFYDPDAGEPQATLDVAVDGEIVTSLTCSIFREELAEDDLPTRNIGFIGNLPPHFWTGRTYRTTLVHRASGTVLAEEDLQTQDCRIDDTGDLFGRFMLTEHGQLAGWASHGGGSNDWQDIRSENIGGQSVTVRVLADETEIDASAAERRRPAWKRSAISLDEPLGCSYSLQLPPSLFDGDQHRIQVVVENSTGTPVTMLDQHLRLVVEHRQAAATEVQRIERGEPDHTSGWEKRARTRSELRVEAIEMTEGHVSVTLSGRTTIPRARLRLGTDTVVLSAVSYRGPQPRRWGRKPAQRRYSGVIPSVPAAANHPLFSPEKGLEGTYDLRLGDENGPRPADLPPTLCPDSPGRLHTSKTVLDGQIFVGWALHTRAPEVPADVVLQRITEAGTTELASTTADLTSQRAQKRHGVRCAGYRLRLPIPTDAGPIHLRLVAVHGAEVRTLWEDRRFWATDRFLLKQALNASTKNRALDVVGRARRAGRTQLVERFLASFPRSSSGVQLEDIEDAVAAYGAAPGSSLEPSSGAIWYWVRELRRNAGRIRWFTQNAIRNRTGDARDVLAYCATLGRFDFDELHGILESYRTPQFRRGARALLRKHHWKTALVCLAQFLYAAPRDELDHLDALTLYSMAESWRGDKAITGPNRAFYGDLLRWRGQAGESHRVLTASDPDEGHDYSQRLLALNTLNPNVTDDGDPEAWLAGLNDLLQAGGAAPVTLTNTDQVSFFAISSQLPPAEPEAEDAPLVSVVVPIYQPNPATDVAIRSLLQQTWRNIEIIIVDDCSPAVDEHGQATGYRQQLEAWAAADSRIRLVFNQTNRGAYSARNDALDLARGELITVADKDDWHHPQQIEIQVRDFLAHPERLANMTNWMRVDEGLRLLLRSGTGRVFYPSMPSLMFRRQPVLTDLGYWDTVRKSGDSEFKARLEKHYGIVVEPLIQAPLAFALMEGANLTRDDMGVGYLAPDRRAYLRGYQQWHRRIRDDGGSPYMPKAPDQRPFVAPPAYLPGQPAEEPVPYDVVFASEFGFLAGNSTSLFTEISVCLQAELRVGVIPIQNGLIPSAAKRQFNSRIDELVHTGRIDRLSLDTEARTDLLIVRWPTAVQLMRDEPARLSTGQAVVVANHPPYEPGGRRSYDVGGVTRTVQRIFGVRPVWAPQSEQIGEMLSPLLPASDLAGYSWKGIIEVKDDAGRNRHRPGRPVIGRHGRDDPAKWPSDGSVFRQVYPADGSADVCILGGTTVPTQLGFMPHNPATWEIYAFNEISVEEYLGEKIDFFVYFHSEGWVEAFGMAILEAMSYGVVCVLPRHFEPVFGEAAVYAEPQNVHQVVSELWEPARYAAQQRRAVDFIERECTPEAYLRRLSRLSVEAVE